jgi:hypothetical protein
MSTATTSAEKMTAVSRELSATDHLSEAELISLSTLLRRACNSVNTRFMRCKARRSDPSACLGLASEVLACTRGAAEAARAQCASQQATYAACLNFNNAQLDKCRPEQKAVQACKVEFEFV